MKDIQMKKTISFMLKALLLIVSINNCEKSNDDEEEIDIKMPFTDHFDNYIAFPGGYWEYEVNEHYGSWSIIKDGTRGNVAAYEGDYGIVVLGQSEWTNYTYTAKLKPSDDTTLYQNYGIIGRYQDADNFYLLHIYKDENHCFLAIDRKYLGTFVNKSQDFFDFHRAQYYKFTFDFNDSIVTGSVEGGPSLSYTDSSIPKGKIGFFAQKPACFDDVSVTSN
jgi:hypothetical protein